jgi:hypothetical protein
MLNARARDRPRPRRGRRICGPPWELCPSAACAYRLGIPALKARSAHALRNESNEAPPIFKSRQRRRTMAKLEPHARNSELAVDVGLSLEFVHFNFCTRIRFPLRQLRNSTHFFFASANAQTRRPGGPRSIKAARERDKPRRAPSIDNHPSVRRKRLRENNKRLECPNEFTAFCYTKNPGAYGARTRYAEDLAVNVRSPALSTDFVHWRLFLSTFSPPTPVSW